MHNIYNQYYASHYLLLYIGPRREKNLILLPLHLRSLNQQFVICSLENIKSICGTVVPTKSDSDVIFCFQLLSSTLICTLHLS